MDDDNSKPPEADGPREEEEKNGSTDVEGDPSRMIAHDRNGSANLAGDPENENENEKHDGDGDGSEEGMAAIEELHVVDGREWQSKSSSPNVPRRARLVREARHGTSEFFEYMRHGYEKSQAAAAAATPSEAEAEAEAKTERDGDHRAKGLPSPTSPSSLSTPELLPSRRRTTLSSSSSSSSTCSSPSPPSSPVVGARSLSPPGLRRERRAAKSAKTAKKGGGSGDNASPGPTLRKSAGDEASSDATTAVPTLKRSQSSVGSKSSSDGTITTTVDISNYGNGDSVGGGGERERKRGSKGRKPRAKEESDAVRLHVRSDEIEVPKQRAAAGFKLNLDGIWRNHQAGGGGGDAGALTPTQESFYNHLRQGAMTRSVSADPCQGSESARAALTTPSPPSSSSASSSSPPSLRAPSPGPGGREARAQSHPIAASTPGSAESSCTNHTKSILSLSLADYLRDDHHGSGGESDASTQQEKPSKRDRDRDSEGSPVGSLRGSARKLITTTGGKFYGKLRSKGSFIAPRRKECDAAAAAGPNMTQDDQSISPRRGRPADALTSMATASTTSLRSPSAAAASFARSPAVSVPSFALLRGKRGLSVGDRHDGFGSGDEVDDALAAVPCSRSVDEVGCGPLGRHQQPRSLSDASPEVNVVMVAIEERIENESQSLSGSGRRRHRTLLHVSSPSSPTLGSRSNSLASTVEATGSAGDLALSSYADECADEYDAGSRRKRDALRGLVKKGIKPLGKTASLVGSRIKSSRSPLRLNNCAQSSDALIESRGSGMTVCDSSELITCGRGGLYDDVVLFGDDDAAGYVDGLDTLVPLVADDRSVGSMDDDALAAATSDSEVSSALLGRSFSPVPSPPSHFMSTPASPIVPLRRSEPGASGTSSFSPPLHSAFHLSSLSPPGYSEFSLHTAQGSLPVPIPLTALISQSSPPSSPSGSPPQQQHYPHQQQLQPNVGAGGSSPPVPRAKNEKRLSRGYSPLSFWRKGGSMAAFHTSSDRIMDARGTTGDSSDSGFGGGGGGNAGGAVCDSPVGSSRQSSADDADADNDDLQSEYQLSQQALRIEVVETEEQQKQHQELLAKLEEMQWRLLSGEGGFERQSRRTKLHKIHSCFRATELVTWILCDLGLQSRTEAAAVGRDLMKENMLHHAKFQITEFIDGQSFYRLQWDSRVAEACLNMRKIWAFPPRYHQVVVKQLNEMLNAMLRNNRSESDGEYDFPAILRSKAFYDFTLATAELQRIPFLEMQAAERQVYFINVYNILFIHAQIVHKLLDLSGGAHFRFFSEMSYQLWGDMYSLNDLQHGLLRSDPARHRRWKGQTKANRALDTPTKWVGALSKRDCRIHFVLFSGNVSCGWVRKQHGAVEVPFIDFAQPDPQLNDAMQTAIVEQTSFNYSRKEIHLPKVFKWYQSDFGQTEGEVLAFVAKFFPEGSAEQNIISNYLTRYRTPAAPPPPCT